MSGRGKGKMVRHRAPLIRVDIPKNSFIKLARKAGIKSISGRAILELQAITEVYLKELIEKAYIVKDASYDSKGTRKRLSESDVKEALRILKLPKVLGGASKKKCKTYTTEKGGPGHRKLRPGTRALREIRFYQNNSDCLVIPEAVMLRKVKLTLQDIEDTMGETSISKDALGMIRESLEDMLVRLLSFAQLAAIHAKRVKVMPSDIQLVRRFTGKRL